jgi:hypothetical protein
LTSEIALSPLADRASPDEDLESAENPPRAPRFAAFSISQPQFVGKRERHGEFPAFSRSL